MLDLLVHASTCRSGSCQYPNCRKVKGLFRHGMQCKTRASGGCALCKKMWYMLQLHARACRDSGCSVPRCRCVGASILCPDMSLLLCFFFAEHFSCAYAFIVFNLEWHLTSTHENHTGISKSTLEGCNSSLTREGELLLTKWWDKEQQKLPRHD
jgi:hypothetical protein